MDTQSKLNVLAIIPARGGSKGVPNKNIRSIAGKPLICHTIEHAMSSQLVTRVVVSTDSNDIAQVSKAAGAEIVMRPAQYASDTASSEQALLHTLSALEETGYEPDLIVFLQCTSPIRKPTDIDNAVRQLLNTGVDSLLSGCKNHRFIWRVIDGYAEPVNYDYRDRKPRQLLPPEFEENGSIYICHYSVLSDDKNRLGGRIGIFEMGPESSLEIDSELDFYLVEKLMEKQ